MRRCIFHVGIHKTGTSTLQAFVTRNERLLASRGLLYPRSGRVHWGHHNLAWELYAEPRFNSELGTLSSLAAELRATQAPLVLVSSEDLEYLHDVPGAIGKLTSAALSAGFQPSFVIDVRPQVDYAESLYATYAIVVAKTYRFSYGQARSFAQYTEEILTTGAFRAFGTNLFEFDQLVDAFVSHVGRENVVVRAFRNSEASNLLEGWATLLFGEVDATLRSTFASTRRENTRESLAAVINALRLPMNARQRHYVRIAGALPFSAIRDNEIEQWERRFSASNARLSARYGVSIGAVSEERKAPATLRALIRDATPN